MLENRLKQYLYQHDLLITDLQIIRSLSLPDCYIAAGYIRNYIWDRLHGFDNRERHNDIDVVYYEPNDYSEDRDYNLEEWLIRETGNHKWSVKNQARMHIRNGDEPYRSTIDALSKWPETVTAVGARIDKDDNIEICNPYGLDDLFNMIVRRSPLFKDRNYYLDRLNKKEWKQQWPLITIIEE